MMKKLLLFAAVAGMSLSAGAQNVDKAALKALKQTRTQTMVSPVAVEQDKPSMFINPNKVGPRKTVLSNLWYTRPEGSLLIPRTGNDYSILLLAPYVEQRFVNRSADKENTTWFLNTSEWEYVEDGDATISYPAGGSYYIPFLQAATEEFVYGKEVSEDSYAVTPDSIYSMSNVNLHGGFYRGFTDGYVFGTNEDTYQDEETGEEKACYCDFITEFFSKPASPMYVTDFWFYYTSNSEVAIPDDGTELTLKVLKVKEDGSLDTDEPIVTIPFGAEAIMTAESASDGGVYGYMQVSLKDTDAFGSITEIPFIIEDEFAVRIEGFHQPGVDFSLYMCDVLATAEDSYEHGQVVYPTIYSYVNEAGEDVGSSWQFIDEETAAERTESLGRQVLPRQFNAALFIDGMFDVAMLVDEGLRQFTAPTEGGICYTDTIYEFSDGTFDHSNVLEVYTTLPWMNTWEGAEPDEENYYIYTDEEEWPDWFYLTGMRDDYDEDGTYIFQFAADKLPKGMNGRKFTFRIGSDKGADTGIITVRQGEPELDAIATTTATAKRDAHAYNLAGVMTKGNFKGLVIKDGKKMMKK